MKTASGILKILTLLLAILIIGFVGYSCVQPQLPSNVAPPRIEINHLTFKVTTGYGRNIPPEIIKVSANEGERIRVIFSVTGFWGSDIDFSMKNPAGDTIFDKRRIPKEFMQDFQASTSGDYQLIFEDSFCLFSRTITLTALVYPK
jgi:hypothetical protein